MKVKPQILAAGLIVIHLGTAVGWAQNFGAPLDTYFRLEWEVGQSKSGPPTITGYIYNDRRIRALNVRLLVEELDGFGRVVSKTIGYVDGDVPAQGRAYFTVPVRSAAATYRVTVDSFDWGYRGS